MTTTPGGSLKTGKGLQELNDLLASRSYIEGTAQATAEDFARFAQINVFPDKSEFPHVSRWYRHIKGLRARHADYWHPAGSAGVDAATSSTANGSADAKKARPEGKAKKENVVDCKVYLCSDRRVPATDPMPLGVAASGPVGGKAKGKYYITTAINYANGWPHIGHAYEALTADVFARFSRFMGRDTFFMTGADEHGQKIAQAAEDKQKTPQAMCDMFCDGFQALNQRLAISNDFYVRTTAEQHKEVAREVWTTCRENGDIYLDRYEGWYLVREEKFVTDQEAEEWGFKDPGSGVPLKKMSEPSFFFRLAKYQQAVIKHIEDNPDFIVPDQYRKEILERVRSIEMRDLSISRGTFSWGVPCPEPPVDGNEHVMYVWFDALINYYSGVHGNEKSHPQSHYWPADMHIVGKDICWFHCVIWPSMLMSAGIPLPKSVVVHGFISGPDGRKMSKTYGNVVDPHDCLDKLPPDTLRWYLCREAQYGDDVKFSEESLKLMHNANLCDNLGNLVHRAVHLCGGKIPDCDYSLVTPPFDLKKLKEETAEAYNSYKLAEAANIVVRACDATNKWIADLEPWKMKDADKQPLRAAAIRVCVEAVYVLAHFFGPFIPVAAEAIFKKVGTEPRAIPDLDDNFKNLKVGTEVYSGSMLFEKFETEKTGAAAPDAKAAAKEKAKDKAKDKKSASAPVEEDPNQPLFSKLEVRVGKIVDAWHHPEAERLFVEKIDIGEPEPRQIVSGLREAYTLEEFKTKKLLVVCNMKPSKLVKVESSGMVLCAKRQDGDKKCIELLSVPDDCNVGDRVLPAGVPDSWQPAEPKKVKEKKIWEHVAEKLRTDANRVACFDGAPLTTAGGSVRFTAPTLPDSEIS